MLPTFNAVLKAQTPSLEPYSQFVAVKTNEVYHASLGDGADTRLLTSSGARGLKTLKLDQATPLRNGKTSMVGINSYTNPDNITYSTRGVQNIFTKTKVNEPGSAKTICDTIDYFRSSDRNLGIRIQEFHASLNKNINGGNYYAHCRDFEDSNREAFERDKEY